MTVIWKNTRKPRGENERTNFISQWITRT